METVVQSETPSLILFRNTSTSFFTVMSLKRIMKRRGFPLFFIMDTKLLCGAHCVSLPSVLYLSPPGVKT